MRLEADAVCVVVYPLGVGGPRLQLEAVLQQPNRYYLDDLVALVQPGWNRELVQCSRADGLLQYRKANTQGGGGVLHPVVRRVTNASRIVR